MAKVLDLAYQYFLAALKRWMDDMKEMGEAPQKLIAIKTGATEGTVSKYVSPKRKKPIPFEQQVAFANACGFEYYEFIKNGKNIVEAGLPLVNKMRKIANDQTIQNDSSDIKTGDTCDSCGKKVVSIDNSKYQHHARIISRFKDQDIAAKVNEMLVGIEDANPIEYGKLIGKIEDAYERIVESNKGNGQNQKRTGTNNQPE